MFAAHVRPTVPINKMPREVCGFWVLYVWMASVVLLVCNDYLVFG